MFDFYNLCSIFQPCFPNKNGSEMICLMPSINEFMSRLDQTQTVIVTLNFIMDGIKSLKEFSTTNMRLSRYFYYENPKLYKFEGDEKLVLFDIAEEFLKIKVSYSYLNIVLEYFWDNFIGVEMSRCQSS